MQNKKSKTIITVEQGLKDDSEKSTSSVSSIEEYKHDRRSRAPLKQNARTSILTFVIITSIVLVINISCLIYGASIGKLSREEGILRSEKSIYSGSCKRAKRISTVLHFFINLSSVILLSASNFTMQTLTAPTRSMLDKLHSQGKCADVGVSSIQNLWYISRWKKIGWACLVLSSLPLHLLYNSAVYSSLTTQSYVWGLAHPDFVQTPNFNVTYIRNTFQNGYLSPKEDLDYYFDTASMFAKESSGWERLSNDECIKAYSKPFITDRRHVLLLSNNAYVNASALRYFDGVFPSPNAKNWLYYNRSCTTLSIYSNPEICEPMRDENQTFRLNSCANLPYPLLSCSLNPSTLDPHDWEIGLFRVSKVDLDGKSGIYLPEREKSVENYTVDYCMSQRVPEECELFYEPTIMLVVMCMITIKIVCMTLVVIHFGADPLLCLGDVLTTYLERPEDGQQRYKNCRTHPNVVTPASRKWGRAAGRRLWISTWFACFVGFWTIFGFLKLAFDRRLPPLKMSKIGKEGLGTVSWINFVGDGLQTQPSIQEKNSFSLIILANLPQLIISVSYFLYNSVYTHMLMGYELASYAVKRHPLRTTKPRGKQRSSYWLQLPPMFSLPLLMVSVYLHFMASQTLFIVVIGYGKDSPVYPKPLVHLTYSPLGCVLMLIAIAVLFLIVFGLSFRKYPGDLPVKASCSLALSDLCHPPSSDKDAFLHNVRYGVPCTEDETSREESGETSSDRGSEDGTSSQVNRKAFTSLPVRGENVVQKSRC